MQRALTLEGAATGAMLVCALATAGVVLRREVIAKRDREPASVRDFRRYASGLKSTGSPSAPVTLTVFSDFQCPYCRTFAHALDTVLSRKEVEVRFVFRHLPITRIHPQARAAAVAAECAARQNRFKAYHDRLFSLQDSLSSVNWVAIARDAGLSDTAAFRGCLDDKSVEASLRADSLAAQDLRVRATPTFLVNDVMVSGAISADSLQHLVEGRQRRME